MSFADTGIRSGYPEAITLRIMTYGSTTVRTVGNRSKRSDISMTTTIEEYRKKVDERVASGERAERPACLMDTWSDIKMSRYQHLARLQEHRKNIARQHIKSRKPRRDSRKR